MQANLDGLWQLLSDALCNLTQLTQRPIGLQPGQRARQGSHGILGLTIVLCRERHLHSHSTQQVSPLDTLSCTPFRTPDCPMTLAELFAEAVVCSTLLRRTGHLSVTPTNPQQVILSCCKSIACLLIVVEDDNHILVQKACMVHGLIRHAPSDGPIPNHCHTVVLPALHSAR